MTTWTKDELDKIAAADELQIASLRPDATLSKPVTIWVVRIGDDLYIRSYKGRGGSWFRAAQAHHAGRIRAGGVEKVSREARAVPEALAEAQRSVRDTAKRVVSRRRK